MVIEMVGMRKDTFSIVHQLYLCLEGVRDEIERTSLENRVDSIFTSRSECITLQEDLGRFTSIDFDVPCIKLLQASSCSWRRTCLGDDF